ncbi:dTDP-4-dehydrorhamnose 3,5-epimerase [Fundidesulfovibrio agrisoli]|uniref:dTDP-4-dehydrorhamnose 3,5-epimerase n=1 Tax=Fundidesulfovibrio agrisoli TaxID=2922717 RepID=UPI001FADCDA8
MGFEATGIPGLWLYAPKVFQDERGFFMESYNKANLDAQGIACDFIQDNHALSRSRGVLRGLHFQTPPKAQTKLVRVTRGKVLDVVVDLRKGSPTYRQWKSFELTESNFLQLFVPKGFAHGYVTLTENVEFLYKVDELYAPANDSGILWCDPDLNIDWGVSDPILSPKDTKLGLFKDFESPFVYEG